MNERYYVDEEDDDWYVFDSGQNPHKAVSSWSCEQDAKEDADRRNNLVKFRSKQPYGINQK
jgi:hypothetical protein